MGQISADTFRRVYLLYVIGQFSKGSYGSVRLQKINYIVQRNNPTVRPFGFKKWRHGQFSHQLDVMKEQLVSMGYVGAVPLDTAIVSQMGDEENNQGGNKLFLTEFAGLAIYFRVLKSASPDLPGVISQTVKDFGYKPEAELLDICYQFPEFKAAEEGQVIVESNVSGQLDVDLTDDECDDLEIAMNPKFISAMNRLSDALKDREVPWDRIPELERMPTPGTR